MPRRPLVPMVLAGVLALTAAACSSPEEGPTTPEGWQRVEQGSLSFAVPGDWVEVAQSDTTWSVGWSTDAEPGAGSVLLVGAPSLGDEGAEQALDAFVAGAQVGGWGYTSTGMATPVDEDTLQVQRNDFTYDDVTGVFWSASDPASGTTVGVQVTGRDLPQDVVQGIQDSLAVTPVADAA